MASLSTEIAASSTFVADYPGLFGDENVDRCPADALESSFGPFAYAQSLATIVRRLEAPGSLPGKLLSGRRPDLGKLRLDEPCLNERLPRLTLANECLEAMVASTHGGGAKAAAVLAAATSPAALPFDRSWALVSAVLRHKRQHPWQLLRQTDEDYPNFSSRRIVNSGMRAALSLCLGMAPAQLRALQAAPAANEGALWERLGLPADSTIEKLADSATFLKATGLNRKRLRQLLAVNGVAKDEDTGTYTSVTVSDDGLKDEDARETADGRAFGAHFVNGGALVDGQARPALRLVAGGSSGRRTRIEGLRLDHLHRIDAMLRLHAGTGLPFATLDRLLQAIFGAQGLTDSARTENLQIDANALRALGLYCHLRDSRQVDADTFAAVLHEISPYATGRDIPYYDRLFLRGASGNVPKVAESSLTMDGGRFYNTAADATMQSLCSGLRVAPSTLSELMGWIASARHLTALTRDLSLVSACHRLTVLPRWLGYDERSGLALLRLFRETQRDLFDLLAGVPSLGKGDASDQADVVDAIVTFMNLADWLQRHRLDAARLGSALSDPGPPAVQLMRGIPDLTVEDHAVTGDRLRDALRQMPFAKNPAGRLTGLFSSLIESDGLFKDHVLAMDGDTLQMEIALAIDPLRDKAPGAIVIKLEQTKARVYEMLRECLDGQVSLVDQTLSALLPGIADAALRHSLARWAGATPTALLRMLDNRESPNDAAPTWLQTLRQRAGLAQLLMIDGPTIDAMRSHREWFDLREADLLEPGLVFAHRVTEWNAMVRDIAARTGRAEADAGEDIVAYLARGGGDREGAASLRLADCLKVDKAVVALLERPGAPTKAGPASMTACRMAWLNRLVGLADRTATSVEALLALARLDLQSSPADVEAAENLLLATCEASDADSILAARSDAWRHAMVAWLMHHARDAKGSRFAHKDDLTAFLLTDIDVGPEPETTRLAAAIDSLQMYIHRLLTGLEDHLNMLMNIKNERNEWAAYRSRYVDWRRYKERRAYPENHIHPASRARKTTAFLDLETQLAQGQARPADIDTTLFRYLTDFERTSNLVIISGYHDGVDPSKDELHLIGRTNIEPYEYFWQSARMDVKAGDNHTGMLAWSGWKKITLQVTGQLAKTAIPQTDSAKTSATDSRGSIEALRPLIIGGRKYIVWVERDTSSIVFDTETAASGFYALRVCYSYEDTNGNWSASNTLLSLDGRTDTNSLPNPFSYEKGITAEQKRALLPKYNLPEKKLFLPGFMPGLIVMENRKGKRKAEPYLVAMLFNSQLTSEGTSGWKANDHYFLAARDLLLIDKKELDGASGDNTLESQLVDNWYRLFRDPRVVQHPYIGAKYKLVESLTDKVETKIDPTLETLRKTLTIDDPIDVDLTASLMTDGNDIEVTGTFNNVWSRGSALESVEDIERIDLDFTIKLKLDRDGWQAQQLIHEEMEISEFRIRASIAAEAWDDKSLSITSIETKVEDKVGLGLVIGNSKELLESNGFVIDELTKDHELASVAVLGCLLPQLDVKLKKLAIRTTLSDLKETQALKTAPIVGVRGKRHRDIEFHDTDNLPRNCYIKINGADADDPIGAAIVTHPSDSEVNLKAELIRIGTKVGSTDTKGDDSLRDALAKRDPINSSSTRTESTLYALAMANNAADRVALAEWMPRLTETWRIPAARYYEALRNANLEFSNANADALSGSLPFLQAMHATNRESLRETLVGIMAETLGSTVDPAVRTKIPLTLRTELVRFAVTEQETYRSLLTRLEAMLGGARDTVTFASAVLDAHASGTKRMVARVPANFDDPAYTFCLVLKTTDDPRNPKDLVYKERIRVTRSYNLVKLTEAKTNSPDDRVPTARICRNAAQAQYLDLDESRLPPIRLNTLFGKQLVDRATRSVDAAISIGAQTLPEPALREGGTGGFVDFRGANGLYFWELFFHVPWLVAWSLREKGHFTEAFRWCTRYLFDPYRVGTTDTTAPVPFWNCLPLIYPLDGARDTGETPELAGYEKAIYFRKALHWFLVELWRLEGDEQFRRLTPESVREASTLYHKALRLIGNLQEPAETRPWTPVLLGSRQSSFVQPVNTVLLDARALLLARLDNLNHGRTIDGVLLPYLGYGDEDTGLGTSGGRRGSTSGQRALSIQSIPAYRFREVMAVALAAVERLTDLGRYLFRIHEHEATNALAVEQQKNILALADFDISLKEKALETAKRERGTLEASRKAASGRVDYYKGQLASPRSKLEIAEGVLSNTSAALLYARYLPILTIAVAKAIPKIWGFAFGNAELHGPSEATDKSLQVTAEATRLLAEELRQQAAYERRNEEWRLNANQSEHDVLIVESQMAEQDLRIESASTALAEATRHREYLRSEFEVQTTGFAVASTYTWMLGHLGALFGSAYQSVLALCLDTQASFCYETGEFDTRFVRLDAWDGARKGMFAGEALQNDLQSMQAAFLQRHTRRLSIHKTVSLKKLLDDGVLASKLRNTELSFNLDEKLFDNDFPGHYLRQIQHVAITLVPKPQTKLRADTAIQAILTQTASTVLYRPDPHGAEYMYDPTGSTARAAAVHRDLRGNRQMVLSRAAPPQTAGPMETIVLRTDYADGRYGIFEGTGAVSSWTLSFHGTDEDNAALRGDIEDIEVHLDYFAAPGDAEFSEAVKKLRDAAVKATNPSTGQTPSPPPGPAPEVSANPALVVREVRARHALDRRDTPDGATVTVGGVKAAQKVWLWCFGTTYDGVSINRALRGPSAPVTRKEESQGIKATIDPRYLESLGDYAQLRVVCKVSSDGSDSTVTATTLPELVLDLPKSVALTVRTATTNDDWVLHTSLATPWLSTYAGYLALSDEEGPTVLEWTPTSPTYLTKRVVPVGQTTEQLLKFRARRLWGDGPSQGMNDYGHSRMPASGVGHTYFRIQCLASDNAGLPPGNYKGRLVLQLTGKEVPRVLESLFIDFDIDL